MNVDSVRRFCLSFPSAKENMQWGETLCFKVGGKIFATISLDAVPPSICLKCTPEKFSELMETDGAEPAPYVGRYKWILLRRLDVLPEHELRALIGESFAMVAAKTKVSRQKQSKQRKKRTA